MSLQRSAWFSLTVVVMTSCGMPEDDRYDPETHFEEGEIGVIYQGLTVENATGCSTSIVAGLSEQLIEEINCLRPDTLANYSGSGVSNGSAVWPYLQTAAKNALRQAINDRNDTISINSALRTLAQQYLLYRWYQNGQCGIGLAARPGRSRHESGLAIDTSEYSSWRATLENRGWDWYGSDDTVHFDYEGSGTVDLSGLSVKAFQRLWNRNHPNDQIDEDGLYGPQTESRLRQSPVEGFQVHGCQPAPEPDPQPDPDPQPQPTDDKMEIKVRWITISGQERDLIADGSSAGIFDVTQGQSFEGVLEVRNGVDRPATDDVQVGFWLERPYLRATSWIIETDHPVHDGQTWVRADAHDAFAGVNPAQDAAAGIVTVGVMQPGERRRIRFTVVADRYSYGLAHHPDLRGWIKHVGNYYGEQSDWNDAVEVNNAGEVLRHFGQLDVLGTREWQFEGTEATDVEGWHGCGWTGFDELKVDVTTHALSIHAVGDDSCVVAPTWTRIDASTFDGVTLRVRHHDGARTGRIYFHAEGAAFAQENSAAFETVGNGEFEDLTVDLRELTGWSGVITGLRVDPFDGPVGSNGWFDVDGIRAVTLDPLVVDADGDGVPADTDCNDNDSAVFPNAPETCDGVDNDCDLSADNDPSCTPDEEVPEENNEPEVPEPEAPATPVGPGEDSEGSAPADNAQGCTCAVPRADVSGLAAWVVMGMAMARRWRRG
ncbi:MAG: MopE-related protein [Myxococcota bacterium]